jgi:hypothetical protein
MCSLTDRVCKAPHAQHKKYSAYPGPDGPKFAQGVNDRADRAAIFGGEGSGELVNMTISLAFLAPMRRRARGDEVRKSGC